MLAVTCITTGRVRLKRGARGARRYLPGGWRDSTLPVNVFLVEHPDGLCLFDAGQTARAAERGYFPRWYPFFRLSRFELDRDEEVAPQLRASGVDPGEIRWVVLSHLHTDHAGGIGDFPHSEVVVSRIEWDRAQGVGGRVRGYLPQYWPRSARVRAVDLQFAPVGPFEHSLKLTDDGCLTLVATPGHTPGHLSLLVRDRATSTLVGGDVALDLADLDGVNPQLAAWCRDEDVTFLTTHDDRAAQLTAAATDAEPPPRRKPAERRH
jgi:glyoxylase-like metal-dependent hydrolase (beta-lactamase superfamily II)